MSSKFIYLTDIQVACGVTDEQVRELSNHARITPGDPTGEVSFPDIKGLGPATYSATATHLLDGDVTYQGKNRIGYLVYRKDGFRL